MITIYGHARCGWCNKAKNLAEQYGIKYEWKDTDNFDTLNELKLKFPNARTVPQIWWDDRYIGGYENLTAEIENTMGNYGQDKF
jgi:glutaredoxin 3